MSRKPGGSIYESWGSWYLSATTTKRISLRLVTCQSRKDAEIRRVVIVDIVERLRTAGHSAMMEAFCRQAAKANDDD